MKEVRNNDGKLVCKVDEGARRVHIMRKGSTTILAFTSAGLIVTNLST